MIFAALLTVSVGLLTHPDEQWLAWFEDSAREGAARTMRQFAEAEIVLPKDGGPHGGERFSCDFQPCTRLFFGEVDSGRWPRVAATAPTQFGKTLLCHLLPILWHLFERGETVVVGIPDMRVANDKWEIDFLPVIEASPMLRALRPIKGEGSAGGQVKSSITFRNGAILRFMTASQRDTGRASFTSRVLAATEVDNYPKRGEGSEETDKVSQLEGRLRATTLTERRIYLECTVTKEEGRIWQEYQKGSASRIVCPCPHCRAWMTPERADLKGWQDATSEWETHDKARWHCPACDKPLTEAQREEANQRNVLAHRGQEVTPAGEVVGDPPPVFTFGFRANAFNNLFLTAGDVGVDEWQGARAVDRDAAERKLCQQVHCLPYEDPDVDVERLKIDQIPKQATGKRGVVPLGTVAITVGIDTAKVRLDWVAVAWQRDGSGRIIEYGEYPVDWQKAGVSAGLEAAFRGLVDYHKWDIEGGGGKVVPTQVWIDSGYSEHQAGVYAFCRKINQEMETQLGMERYRPTKGYGERQRNMTRYRAPTKRTAAVRHIGRDFYLERVPGRGVFLVHVNSDVWKAEFHRALNRAPGDAGSVTLYEAADPAAEHADFLQQVDAEELQEIFEEGRGMVKYWHPKRRKNHKLDAGYLAQAAGHFVLTKLTEDRVESKSQPGKWWSSRKQRGRR